MTVYLLAANAGSPFHAEPTHRLARSITDDVEFYAEDAGRADPAYIDGLNKLAAR